MKLRGQRIELGEIEHALRAQPGVVDAVVLLDTRLDALVAYVSPPSAAVSGAVLSDGSPFTPAAAFGRASSLGGATAALPAYMVPSLVVGVATWPRTSSGKIDRKRLPAPEGGAAGGGGGGSMVVAPRSAAEVRVRDAFAAALGIGAAAISVEASFFELGGNSLRAAMLMRRLVSARDTTSLQSIYSHPTVSSLAAAIDSSSSGHPPRSDACQQLAPPTRISCLRRCMLAAFATISLPAYDGMHLLSAYVPQLVMIMSVAAFGWSPVVLLIFFGDLLQFMSLAIVAIVAKWCLVGRMHERACLSVLRWRCGRLVHALLLPVLQNVRSTVLMNALLRALGTNVSWSAVIETTEVLDWDFISIEDDAIIEEGASVSGVHQLDLDDLRLQPAVVNALVGAKAHVPGGSDVQSDVTPFQCATQAHASRRPDEPRMRMSSCPLHIWFRASVCYSVLNQLSLLVPLAATALVFLGLGLALVHNEAGNFDFAATALSMAAAPSWKVFLVTFTYGLFTQLLMPLVFVALAVPARRACVPYVVDGDPFEHDVGGFFLQMVLRSHHVHMVEEWW